MKKGRSLQDLAIEIKRQSENKRDFVQETNLLKMNDRGELFIEGINEGAGENFGVTDHAHTQIGAKVGIPNKYYGKMMEEAPDLLATNVNHWFNTQSEHRMIRTLDNNVRAFLSNRYRPLENEDLAEAVLPILLEADADIASCDITDKYMYLKAILPGKKVEIGPPEGFKWGEGNAQVHVVEPGIVISNSEIGLGALRVSPAVHTIHCSNLAVVRDSNFRKLHVGEKLSNSHKGEIWRYLSDDTKRITDKAVWSQIKDLVKQALMGEIFDEIVENLKQARSSPIEGNPMQAIQEVSKINYLRQDEEKSILQHLVAGGELSQYGLHAAVTRSSQDSKTYDRASELEELGGNIIQLPRSEWAHIAEAA